MTLCVPPTSPHLAVGRCHLFTAPKPGEGGSIHPVPSVCQGLEHIPPVVTKCTKPMDEQQCRGIGVTIGRLHGAEVCRRVWEEHKGIVWT
jgi:hypothetical protein